MNYSDGWCAEPKLIEQDFEPAFIWYDADGVPHHNPKVSLGFDLSVED